MKKSTNDIDRRVQDIKNLINNSTEKPSVVVKQFAKEHYLSESTIWKDLKK